MGEKQTINCCKIVRSTLLIVVSIQLYYFLYFVFSKFSVLSFFTSFLAVLCFFKWFLHQIDSISVGRIIENMLILKKISTKTDLMPVEKAKINPMYQGRKIVVIHVKYYIDGIRRNALVLTNLNEFKEIKKRQAVSRVL